MRRTIQALLLSGCLGCLGSVGLGACAHSTIGWPAAPGPEDPSPAGPPYLRDYKESFYRALGTELTGAVDWDELLAELARAQVLYLGDHHDDAELHERQLVLLEVLAAAGVRPVLGVESIGNEDEDALRRYLDGSISYQRMGDDIRARWPESWLDPQPELDSAFYGAVLRLARERGIPVFALEPTPRLALPLRDEVIARRVRRACDRHTGQLVVVVLGHTHLLGEGDVVGRVGRPHVLLGARMSVTLGRRMAEQAPRDAPFLRTDAGVLFFNPSARADHPRHHPAGR